MKTVEIPRPIVQPGSSRSPLSRLISLDVLRGITIAFMILVNTSIRNYAYPALEHSKWNGCTPTDLVFPTFLFVVGISLVFSFEARLSRGVARSSLLMHVLRRASLLFLLGLVIRFADFLQGSNMRIYGVLQRTALCFLLAGILYLVDQRPWMHAGFVAVALIGYWLLMRWTPVPGLGIPGREISLFDPVQNLGAYIDRHLFPGHLSRGQYDTEGLLGTLLPATATTTLGVLTGMWLRGGLTLVGKCWGMLAAGAAAIALGLVWGSSFPINKQLWTSSYVLFAAGCSLVALSLLYWVIEIRGWRMRWTYIWLVFGLNPITAYLFSELLDAFMALTHIPSHGASLKHSLAGLFLAAIPSHPLASLAYSLTMVAICFVPAAILYQKKIFLKV